MKQIKKLKLSELSKNELEKRQMNILKGGDYCSSKCGTLSPPSADASSYWKGYF